MDNKTRRRIHFFDRGAHWLITLGGIGVILCMVVMIVLMVKVAWPLFQDAETTVQNKMEGTDRDVVAFSFDDYFENAYFIDRSGALRVHRLKGGELVFEKELRQQGEIVHAHANPDHRITLVWDDGTVTLEAIFFRSEFEPGGERSIQVSHQTMATFEGASTNAALAIADASRRVLVQQTSQGLEIRLETEEEDLFGDVDVVSISDVIVEPKITDFALNDSGDELVIATETGYLSLWQIRQSGAKEKARTAVGEPVRHVAYLYGDVSLAVATDADLSVWFTVNKVLTRIRTLSDEWAGALELIPSRRDKSVLALLSDGHVEQFHSTTGRSVLRVDGEVPIRAFMLNYQGLGVMTRDLKDQYVFWELDNPHPDVSFSTLWLPVWYEGYPEPVFTWQSSASTDDFEPKTSLVPLLFGSLKGTIYSLIFALPIAILGAIYTSYLMDPRWKRLVKPAIELMAAIPTVVIGFLAALWLAPRFENHVPAVFLSLLLIPAVVMIGMIGFRYFFGRPRIGYEFYRILPLVGVGFLLSVVFGGWLQEWIFAGDFRLWYFETFAQGVDQRNCVVIAFALGFAVIPIIFTISEDALSNVPAHITAASLALGATPWQTLWRVVLPMASPGIFAAAMIGFGRAVGETMIVLMATGNTPILDWSIFNGMRTLSANIAVEIPEAPVNGSLYRILFLTALLLFVLTFVVNTAAEFVRHRLNKKYSQV